MTNKLPPARMLPDARRDHIVQVAAAHFVRDGYDGASMTAIAREAGVTRPLVYHYFSGKSALLEAVLKSESDALLAATRPDPDRPADENLRNALITYFDHFALPSGQMHHLTVNASGASLLVNELTRSNHAVQVARIIALLALDDTAFARSVVNAWLEFVTTLAQTPPDHLTESRDAILAICLTTLEAATRQLNRTGDPAARPTTPVSYANPPQGKDEK